jgi:hypothetical protein
VADWLGLAAEDARALGAFCDYVPDPPASYRPEKVDRMCRALPAEAAAIRAHAEQAAAFLHQPASARAYWKSCWESGFDEFMDWLAASGEFEPRRAGAAVARAEAL